MNKARSGRQRAGSLVLLVGAVALAGLLVYGWVSGQELPLWPALLVAGVNLVGAVKLLLEARARKAAAAQAVAGGQLPDHARQA